MRLLCSVVNSFLITIVINIGIFFTSTCLASNWSYETQGLWPGECQNGQTQSPINLEYSIAVEKKYAAFNLTNYNVLQKGTLINNGHTVQITFQNNGSLPEVTGGGLSDVYVFEQLHFHWESEHTINNNRYPLELHLVHYAKKYGNFSNALLYPNGVAVFAVLFHISPHDDEYFKSFLKLLPQIETVSSIQLNKLLTPTIFLPRDYNSFFRYDGSLTTPACNEGVIWTVFTYTLPISVEQATQFQTILSGENEKLVKNYRKIQPRNDRNVFLIGSKGISAANVLNIPSFGMYVLLIAFGIKYLA